MAAAQLTDAKERMSQLRASLQREVEQIRHSARYSDQGREQALAAVVLAHRRQAESLRGTLATTRGLALGCMPSSLGSRAVPTPRLFS